MPPDVIFTAGARLLIAGAAGAIVGGVVKDQLAWVAAFAVGLLPPQSVLRFIDEQARKFVKLPDVSTIAEDPNLALLQGWNADVAKKFARAGVISIQQLACSNQFQLFLRSNIEWRVILDLSDQALLMLYVGDSIRKLNPLGMRSAVELAALDWYREDEDFFKGFTYEEAIKRIAIAIESDELAVRLLVRSVSEDATVKFLGVLWSDDTPSGGEDEDGGEDEGVEEDEDAKEQPAQSTEM